MYPSFNWRKVKKCNQVSTEERFRCVLKFQLEKGLDVYQSSTGERFRCVPKFQLKKGLDMYQSSTGERQNKRLKFTLTIVSSFSPLEDI